MRYTRAQIVDGTGFEPNALFEQVEDYNGWTNRETWAVALYVNNDQGWQESVLDALRENITDLPEGAGMTDYLAGELIKDNVESWLTEDQHEGYDGPEASRNLRWQRDTLHDIGSLYRVNWDELGGAFLTDVAEASA